MADIIQKLLSDLPSKKNQFQAALLFSSKDDKKDEKQTGDITSLLEKISLLDKMLTFRPTFDITENMAVDLGDKKIGEKVKLSISYIVTEKTENFVTLKVNSMSLATTKRVF